MFFKYAWLLALIASVYVASRYDYLKEINLDFLHKGLSVLNINFSDQNEKLTTYIKELNSRERVFTIHELERYNNLENGLYLSILGHVFDVSKGAKHYGPGATYHAFIGKDASLAFITGEFTKKGLTDDISSLSVQQVKALNDWLKFYNENYVYKGKLSGRYYNQDGSPTEESHSLEEKLLRAKENSYMEEQRKKMFPPCNIEWKPDSGTVVWCTKRSGGIERDWIGVPRILYESPGSKQYRCACVNLGSREYMEFKGSIRNYIGCDENSPKCLAIVDKE